MTYSLLTFQQHSTSSSPLSFFDLEEVDFGLVEELAAGADGLAFGFGFGFSFGSFGLGLGLASSSSSTSMASSFESFLALDLSFGLGFDGPSAPDEEALGFGLDVFLASLVIAISPLASDAVLAPEESESLSLGDPESEPDALKSSEKKKRL